ncbi:MAG: hypothetical protein IKX84_02100 [Clostridia bacterium]|nr:hypothetical protein [Clostridia bacterium]
MEMRFYDPLDFTRLGRQEASPQHCRLWWTGSGVSFDAACTRVEMEIEAFASEHAVWLAVLAGGAAIARFPLGQGRQVYTVLAGMDPAFTHEISVVRDCQPLPDETRPPVIHAVLSDGELKPSAPKKQLIEFLGDSLSVGEGCFGPRYAEDWRMAWMSGVGAFPHRAAEMLGAERRVVAMSGWGAWKSWDGDENHRLGLIYDKLCAPIASGDVPYAFDGRQADWVVINLGTNDSNAIKQETDSASAAGAFTRRVEELIKTVRGRQKNAYILWAYGLCGTAMEQYILRAVEQVKAEGDQKVGYLRLSDCDGDLGSRMHPSRAAHQKAAEEICGYIRNIEKDPAGEA